MELFVQEVQNHIGEIELGDIFYFPLSNKWYIVMVDNKKEFYCLRDLNGVGVLDEYDKHNTLESLRQSLMSMLYTRVIHYPAKEYLLQVVKK